MWSKFNILKQSKYINISVLESLKLKASEVLSEFINLDIHFINIFLISKTIYFFVFNQEKIDLSRISFTKNVII